MATAIRNIPGPEAELAPDVEAFLRDIGEASRRHGLALTDGAKLYVMEAEDFARSYLADDESALSFA